LLLIDAEIASASDQVSADCLRAKRAAYLVRQGHLAEARAVLDVLRAKYDAHPTAAISSWLNFVGGVSLVFEGRNAEAVDKMQRAHVLASAVGFLPMRALCAGWLANLKFGVLDIQAVGDRLAEALQYATRDDHQALSRACLVAAVSLHFGGRYDLARPWYESAQAHAVKESDEATLSALMHNKACMSISNLRQAALTGAVAPTRQLIPDALLQANSTINYDSLVGTESASTWAPILRAQALSLYGRFAEALDAYGVHVELGKSQGLSRVLCYMYADIAWCASQMGDLHKSRASAELAIRSVEPSTLVDDRAATHSRLAAVFKVLGAVEEGTHHAAVAADAWAAFGQLQRQIITRLTHLAPK
jgi:tetratricopeptide (TPR) repeat protein